MKTYFTKYLPVEGEIKEGDMVLDTLSGEIVCWWDGDNWDKHDKKVKLFLCSRDIQVGDSNITTYSYKNDMKLMHKSGLVFIELLPSGRAHLAADGFSAACPLPIVKDENEKFGFKSDTFKIIGEVSPEATWVTEDMEFDEEELDVFFYVFNDNKPLFHFEIKNYKTFVDVKRGEIIIKIKCPTCKQFH